MAMLEVELMALEIHFENCGILRAPVPGLFVYLDIYVKLGQEGLDITLIFDIQKSILEVLVSARFLLLSSSLGGLLIPPLIYELLVRFL